MSRTLSVLFLGGCLVHGPIANLVKAGDAGIRSAPLSSGGGTPPAYSFGEIFQVISLYRGEVEMPSEIRNLCGVKLAFRPHPGIGDFAKVDAAIIEPISPVDIKYRGFTLNRAALFRHATNPIKTDRRRMGVANRWFKKGIMGMDAAELRASGAELADLVPDSLPMADTVRDVFLNAYGERVDVDACLKEIVRLIDRPTGVMTYMFQYMPDGRPLSWPPEFHDEVVASAEAMGLPVFQPWQLVRDRGAENVLMPDFRHYQEHFIPVVAWAIRDFAMQIYQNAEAENTIAKAS